MVSTDPFLVDARHDTLHLYSWYGSKKLCFLQTTSKTEQNQTKTKNKNMPRTVKLKKGYRVFAVEGTGSMVFLSRKRSVRSVQLALSKQRLLNESANPQKKLKSNWPKWVSVKIGDPGFPWFHLKPTAKRVSAGKRQV